MKIHCRIIAKIVIKDFEKELEMLKLEDNNNEIELLDTNLTDNTQKTFNDILNENNKVVEDNIIDTPVIKEVDIEIPEKKVESITDDQYFDDFFQDEE